MPSGKNESDWIVVQTGPNKFSVGHAVYAADLKTFLVRFSNIVGHGNAVALCVVLNKMRGPFRLEKIPEWSHKHVCQWEPV